MYGTMIHVRTRIVTYAAIGLSKAVTIAVRYSVVRRQGQETTGSVISLRGRVGVGSVFVKK